VAPFTCQHPTEPCGSGSPYELDKEAHAHEDGRGRASQLIPPRNNFGENIEGRLLREFVNGHVYDRFQDWSAAVRGLGARAKAQTATGCSCITNSLTSAPRDGRVGPVKALSRR